MNLDLLRQSLKYHEGLRLKPYLDTTGNWTIGYGRNLSAKGVSLGEADYLLEGDTQEAVAVAQVQNWWPVITGSDVRMRAAAELVFNLGAGKLKNFVKFSAALSAGHYDVAAAELLNSLWAKQVGKRAEIIASMIKDGDSYNVTTGANA